MLTIKCGPTVYLESTVHDANTLRLIHRKLHLIKKHTQSAKNKIQMYREQRLQKKKKSLEKHRANNTLSVKFMLITSSEFNAG